VTKRKQKLDTGAGSEGVPAAVLQQAREVLAANDRGCFTVPTAPLYPHQWLWDSAWIALGWAESDERRAWAELESLFSAQWADGAAVSASVAVGLGVDRPGLGRKRRAAGVGRAGVAVFGPVGRRHAAAHRVSQRRKDVFPGARRLADGDGPGQ